MKVHQLMHPVLEGDRCRNLLHPVVVLAAGELRRQPSCRGDAAVPRPMSWPISSSHLMMPCSRNSLVRRCPSMNESLGTF